jgi:CRISPR system Cascade subunit CasB
MNEERDSELAYRPFELRRRSGESSDPAEAIFRWWTRLAGGESHDGDSVARRLPAGVRATLRRVATPDDALLTEGFRSLWFELPPARRRTADMLAWACVAVALSEVRGHDASRSFAAAMGAESERGSGNPRVSELRFNQLLRSNDLGELLRRARRSIHLLGDQVHVVSLADDLLHWHREKGGNLSPRPDRRLAVRWANDYFSALARYQPLG